MPHSCFSFCSKYHALYGSMLSLFLADAFVSAAKLLALKQVEDELLIFEMMQENENKAFKWFLEDSLKYAQNNSLPPNKAWTKISVPHQSVCHTSRLPSQTRYLGYLTNTNKTGGPAVFGNEKYDVGVEASEATRPVHNGKLELVWREDKRLKRNNQGECPFIVAPGMSSNDSIIV
jgi:hypothetical protein